MALPEQNLVPIEPQIVAPAKDSQLWQPPPAYDPKETIDGHGLKPYLRLVRIVWTSPGLQYCSSVHSKGWFKRKDESEEARLHKQGAWVRDRFVALGPTFIKMVSRCRLESI